MGKTELERVVKHLYSFLDVNPEIMYVSNPREAIHNVGIMLHNDEKKRSKWQPYSLPRKLDTEYRHSVLDRLDRSVRTVRLSRRSNWGRMTDFLPILSSVFPNFVRVGIHILRQYTDDPGVLRTYDRTAQIILSSVEPYLLPVGGVEDAFMVFFTDECVVVVEPPEELHHRPFGQLHNEDGPAVRYKDGTELYAVSGNIVPKKVIMNPEDITQEDIMKELNVEVRRLMFEKMGADRFFEVMDFEVLDTAKVNGNKVELLQTKKFDVVLRQHIRYIRVLCPSTDRHYHLCVPPTISGAVEGLAWTFDMSPDEYLLISET